jgi:hypothetical protein
LAKAALLVARQFEAEGARDALRDRSLQREMSVKRSSNFSAHMHAPACDLDHFERGLHAVADALDPPAENVFTFSSRPASSVLLPEPR